MTKATRDDECRYQIGVDIGGTFTDVIALGSDGSITSNKSLSTPDDYGRGIVTAILQTLAQFKAGPDSIERVVHATTVATNAILEHRGSRVGLVTTKGFRDVLEMRRLRIPEMYALNWKKPEPLVSRELRLEVDERIGPRGEVWKELDEASVRRAGEKLRASGVEAVSVSLLHSYANAAHEQRVAAILKEMLEYHVFVSCSSDVLPVIREYERTSTTVINAFLGPTLEKYFSSLSAHLMNAGITAPLQVMKSDGGIMAVQTAMKLPAYLIESGPAAGVIGAGWLSQTLKLSDCITLDMGGTTAKASIVENGEVPRTGDYEVGAGINLSSKLVIGGGYSLKLPVIDISEIGAGGGSLVTVDDGGLLHVGPRSAGSVPGPVAYDLGGLDPTFTDAVVSLGYLSPAGIAGGAMALNADKARDVLQDRIADPLNIDLLQAAYGIFQVACGTMTRAVKAVSTYRGRDPRDFALFAFGGNGPVVAAHVAEILEMKKIIIPPHPGVFSAYGLLLSDVVHEMAQGYLRSLSRIDVADIRQHYVAMENELLQSLREAGYEDDAVQFTWLADLRYSGQAHELSTKVPVTPDRTFEMAGLIEAFETEHEKTYGHRAKADAVECVTLRITARVAMQSEGSQQQRVSLKAAGSPADTIRSAFFRDRVYETPIVSRTDLLDRKKSGPLIVEEYDSTCVVPPGWSVVVDKSGVINLEAE